MNIIKKWTQVFLQCCVLLFWILSLMAQQSPDYSDTQHPSRMPWYLNHSCSVTQPQNQPACHVAQASFGMTIILMYGLIPFTHLLTELESCFYLTSIWGTIAYESSNSYVSKSCTLEDVVLKTWKKDDSPFLRAWEEQ
jgi:hypothetical protein